MDLLTPTVNVPAERMRLRRLRNAINDQAQQRLKRERKFSDPGYGRLPDMQAMEPKGERRHGPAPAGPLQPATALGLLPADALLQGLHASGHESSGVQKGMGG